MNRLATSFALILVASIPAFAHGVKPAGTTEWVAVSGGSIAIDAAKTPIPDATFPPIVQPTVPSVVDTEAPSTATPSVADTPMPVPDAPSTGTPAPGGTPGYPNFVHLNAASPTAIASAAASPTPPPAFAQPTTAPVSGKLTPETAAPSAEPTTAPAPVPTSLLEDPTVSAKAREWLLRLQSDNFDRKQLDAKFNAEITDEHLKEVSGLVLGYGTLVSFTFRGASTYPEGVVYTYNAEFTSRDATWYFAIDNEGRIGGMQLISKQ